ncbi:MAG TPA: tol-pal system protein YbgF [Desulfuromonadaceae bacterium]
MPSGLRWIATTIAGLVLIGCANNDLIIKRQTEAEAKIEHLLQVSKNTEQRYNELFSRNQSLEDQVKGLTAEISQLRSLTQEQRNSQDELKARIALLTQQYATPKVEVVNPESTSKGKDNGPPAEYVQAFGLYSANNFSAAIEAFGSFIKNNPQSDFIANAIYWIGECHYSQSNLEQALESFQKVVDNYPKSGKAPDAMLKLGFTLSAMKEKEKAVALFESLIKLYPSSPAAAKAREKITAN